MIITVLAFLACYIPPTFIAAWVGSTNSTVIKAWAPHLAYISIFISSAINPVIYCFRVRRFRLALNQLLQDPCGKSTFQETKRQLRDREQGNVGGAEKGKKIDNKFHKKKSGTYARNRVMPKPNNLTEARSKEEREDYTHHEFNMEVHPEPNNLSTKTKKSAAATRTLSFTRKDSVEEIHADPMDSPPINMLIRGSIGNIKSPCMETVCAYPCLCF